MEVNTDFSTVELVAGLGGILNVIAAFLPWVTADVQAGPVNVDASASGIEELGVLTLVFGVVVVATLLLENGGRDAIIVALAGIATLVVGLWEFISLEGAASPGIGLYLTIVAGIIIVAAGGWAYTTGASPTR